MVGYIILFKFSEAILTMPLKTVGPTSIVRIVAPYLTLLSNGS